MASGPFEPEESSDRRAMPIDGVDDSVGLTQREDVKSPRDRAPARQRLSDLADHRSTRKVLALGRSRHQERRRGVDVRLEADEPERVEACDEARDGETERCLCVVNEHDGFGAPTVPRLECVPLLWP